MIKYILQVINREATVASNSDLEQPFKVILNKKNKKNGQCNIFGSSLSVFLIVIFSS